LRDQSIQFAFTACRANYIAGFAFSTEFTLMLGKIIKCLKQHTMRAKVVLRLL